MTNVCRSGLDMSLLNLHAYSVQGCAMRTQRSSCLEFSLALRKHHARRFSTATAWCADLLSTVGHRPQPHAMLALDTSHHLMLPMQRVVVRPRRARSKALAAHRLRRIQCGNPNSVVHDHFLAATGQLQRVTTAGSVRDARP